MESRGKDTGYIEVMVYGCQFTVYGSYLRFMGSHAGAWEPGMFTQP